MWVEEKTVRAPGEGLGALVEILVVRNLGKFAAVLLPDVILVKFVLSFNVVDPSGAQNHWMVW